MIWMYDPITTLQTPQESTMYIVFSIWTFRIFTSYSSTNCCQVACQVQRVKGGGWTNVKGLSSQYLSLFSSLDLSVSMPLTQANFYSSHIYRLCQSINSYDWTSFNSSFDSRVQLSIIPSKITIIVIDIVVVCHSNITGWSSKFAVAEATFKHTNSNIIYSLTGNSHGKDIFIHDYQNVNFLITVRTE